MACKATIKGTGVDGQCGNIVAAKDPESECPDPQGPCDAPGYCNGNGACAPKAVAGTVCLGGSCNVATATDPSLCNGNGSCVAGLQHPCANGCSASVCKMACTLNTDCPPLQYCTNGACAPTKVIGAPCGSTAECAAGNCVEGVCCNSACSGGACQTCLQAKGAPSDGACTLLNGVAPAGACSDGSLCTDDACVGGACANPAKTCPAAPTCTVAGTCDPTTGACSQPQPLKCPDALKCEVAGTCDPITGVCAPGAVACPPPSDACHIAGTCDPTGDAGTCSPETVKVCTGDGIAVCDTLVCDLSLQGQCVVRSKLDGAKCTSGTHDGICVAGSCFTVTGTNGSGGAGGTMSTSNATGANAATGGASEAGGGGGGGFHFIGGACTIVDGVNDDDARLAWLLVGLLIASRRRPRRASTTPARGPRDA
jgi:hypothetical protein